MKVFLNSVSDLNGEYTLFKKNNNLNKKILNKNNTYTFHGKYSIQTVDAERSSLIRKTKTKAIFTLGLILLSKEARANLHGNRVDKIYLKSDHAKKETLPQLRARIYRETLKACKEGYLNQNQVQVKMDHSLMLKETETYKELQPLDPPEELFNTQFSVITEDTFQVLLQRKAEGANPVGINMANRYSPGGGVVEGCPAQEEALCRRSNHILGLKTQDYPLPEHGGIYCPHVQIFRDTEENGYAFLDQPEEVHLVAMAVYDLRHNSKDRSQLSLPLKDSLSPETLRSCDAFMEGTKSKIRNMLRIMAEKGHTHLVLGALGCGAFATPPEIISEIFQIIFNETEFKGRFGRVDFAILKMVPKDQANIEAFNKICENLNG